MVEIARVVYFDLPYSTRGFLMKHSDDTATIVLNSRYNIEQNKKTYLHEVGHLENNDFYSHLCATEIEQLRRSG